MSIGSKDHEYENYFEYLDYLELIESRAKGNGGYPADEPFRVTLHPERMDEPFSLRKPAKIFVCSMGDLFHPNVPKDFIDRVISTIPALPEHVFILLTKRPALMLNYFFGKRITYNCWLGVSVENQETADERIPILLQIPTAHRFVSVEPMLERIELPLQRPCTLCNGTASVPAEAGGGKACPRCFSNGQFVDPDQISWVICGAETGPKARPMKLEWARDLRDQCRAAGIPFFFKKAGPGIETPEDLKVREWVARLTENKA